MSNRGEKPDWTHSYSPSRRQVLVFGAAAMGSLAGCNRIPTSGETSGIEATEDQTDRKRTIRIQDQSIDSVEFDALLVESISEHDEVEFTVRVYTSPNLDQENWGKVGETTITQSSELETHSIDWNLPLGYAQRLRFTIEMLSPEKQAEEDATIEMLAAEEGTEGTDRRSGATIVPFYNAARDTEMVRVEPPATPKGDWALTDPFYKTDFWFDVPEESPFNTPEVPEDEYDPDWYDYRNITMTALIRFPNYENITEFPGSEEDVPTHSPSFDWAVVNLSLDAWELIEAVRWNSIATQKLESGEYSYGNGEAGLVETVTDYGSTNNPTREIELDASSQTLPFTAYVRLRHMGARWDEVSTNPLLMNGGRPFSMRAADALTEAFDNPNFETIESKEFHKAIALQVFVGQNPYGFTTGEYVKTPEEVVKNWYKVSADEIDSVGFCQDATALYGGIAVHLLDSTYGVIGMQGGAGYHIMGGLLDLQKPERPYEVWPDHPSPTAESVFTFDTDFGTVSTVECTWPDPTIGWKNPDGSDYELLSYLSNTGVHSHIPINNNYEPDMDGSVNTERDPEIPWDFHKEFRTIDDIENFRAS